jgi:hypothetical protein
MSELGDGNRVASSDVLHKDSMHERDVNGHCMHNSTEGFEFLGLCYRWPCRPVALEIGESSF